MALITQIPQPSVHSSGPATSSSGGTVPHPVPPNFTPFALPFPSRVEKLLFQYPAAVVLVTGLVRLIGSRLISGQFDRLFCLVMLTLAVSATLFRLWMHSIPTLLQQLYDQCATDKHTEFKGFLDDTFDRLMSRRRFLPIGAGLGVAIAFLASFLWRIPTLPLILTWSVCLLPWAYMIGSAGAVAYGLARLVRKIGAAGVLDILPEHPDGCGGLKFVSMFFARMVSPLILVSMLLGFAAVNPKVTITQATIFWENPFAEERALRFQMLSEVGAARIEHLKTECSKLEVPPQSSLYEDCITSLITEANAVNEAQRKGHTGLWNRRIVPFARVGLLILTVSIGLCFIWPLGSVHTAMMMARDKTGLELARSLDNTANHFSAKLKEQALKEAAELSEHLEKVRKQVLRVRRYPVWPFDAASVSKVAIPQVLALGSSLGGFLADWLSR